MVTAMLLKAYKFTPLQLSEDYASTVVLPMKDGLHVFAQYRNENTL